MRTPAPPPDRFLLTGCASGIGRHLADELLARGHRVLATDVDDEALIAHAAAARWPEERARCERLDVRDPQACPDAVATPMLERQLDYPEAALSFTAPRVLTVEDLSRVILGRVLKRRPVLVVLPRWRGWRTCRRARPDSSGR